MPDKKLHESLSGWWALREVDALFGRFARYTRFVVYSKWSLLLLAGALVASLIAWPLLSKDTSGLRVSFVDNKVVPVNPASPVMSNPQFYGVGSAGQQYTIHGKRATQKTSTLVVINDASARLVKVNGSWFTVTADRADYQQDKKIIDLYGNVTLIDGAGMRFVTEHATVETNNLHVYGSDAIAGTTNNGNILASGFEITDNGEHITFMRGNEPVRTTVDKAEKK